MEMCNQLRLILGARVSSPTKAMALNGLREALCALIDEERRAMDAACACVGERLARLKIASAS
jgi:hypothetical protein